MHRWKFTAALVALLLGLPYALLMVAGGVWLYQNGLLLEFFLGTAVLMIVGWLLAGRFKTIRPLKLAAEVKPGEHWSPMGEKAWQDVEKLAERIERNPPPFDKADRWWLLVRETLDTVAKQYHPKSDRPSLEVSLPDTLQIVELVSRDLRKTLRERIPGSHMVTINDFNRIKKLAGWWQQLYMGYRLLNFGFNPLGAVVRELRDAASGQMIDLSTDEIQRWAAGYCVRKAGFYAIQLYSGQLVADEEAFRDYVTKQSREDAGESQAAAERTAGEPLRALVVGQTKAGKSSLINALFGEVRAATDVIPLTAGIEPYVMEREGLPRAIILDTAGYATTDKHTLRELNEALLKTDLILLVCSARSAAREPDRALLADLHERFAADPERLMPPVVVALTHIDSLRPFAEWAPPYNLKEPNSPKAESIAAAVKAVATDLQLPEERVVPVCLLPERRYNVEEGLLPAVLATLPSAERAKLLRTLRQFRDEQYWQLLWEQAAGAGRFLAEAGATWAGHKAEDFARRMAGRE